MSTRSYIVKLTGNTYKGIYCHHSGHKHLETLQECYYYTDIVDQLIDLGALSWLGKEIGYKREFSLASTIHKKTCLKEELLKKALENNDLDSAVEIQKEIDSLNQLAKYNFNQCLAYHRDRGDTKEILTFENLENLKQNAKKSWVDYVYIFSGGKWSKLDLYEVY